ncbi:MAG: DNA-directed RNA polymerase subunit omega [Planctomycetota bacterium]
MIEALKSEEIVNAAGGRFKLTVLVQRRLVELMDGARPLVEREGRSDLELVIEEVRQGKIALTTAEEAEAQLAEAEEPLL